MVGFADGADWLRADNQLDVFCGIALVFCFYRIKKIQWI
jgi:hypothetical protein